jgi:hypothetical protein
MATLRLGGSMENIFLSLSARVIIMATIVANKSQRQNSSKADIREEAKCHTHHAGHGFNGSQNTGD